VEKGGVVHPSEQLSQLLHALREISPVAADAFQRVVKADLEQLRAMGRGRRGKGHHHEASAATIQELNDRLAEEEDQKNQVLDLKNAMEEQLRATAEKLTEAQDKLAMLEARDAERGTHAHQQEEELTRISEELVAAQHQARQEEQECAKLLEKMQRKEAETARFRESMDRMALQMQRLGEERDTLQQQLDDAKGEGEELQAQADRLQRELAKVQSAERVMKRNVQVQMPGEVKKVVRRVEELEKQNRELSRKVEDSKAHSGDGSHLIDALRSEVLEHRVHGKALESQIEQLKADKEALEKRAHGERRLLEGRTRNLFEQNVRSIHKLQGEQDLRLAERLKNGSSGNEIATLRRKNLDLINQVNTLELARDRGEARAAEQEARCKDLLQKLEIYAAMHKVRAKTPPHTAPRSRPPTASCIAPVQSGRWWAVRRGR
jgi:chromosome segregation ATPase